MFGFLQPPEIPAPVKPEDFTKQERDRLRGVVTDGDPLRARRDQTGIDRLLTNAQTEIVAPTGAATLAGRQHANDQISRDIAEFLGQSSQLEEERRYQSEARLGELESERQRDMDEYDQLVQAHQAAEEVARKNWQSGLLRAGAGLLSVAAPAIGAGVGALLASDENQNEAGVGFGNMSDEARGNYLDNVSPLPSIDGNDWWGRQEDDIMPGISQGPNPGARPMYSGTYG